MGVEVIHIAALVGMIVSALDVRYIRAGLRVYDPAFMRVYCILRSRKHSIKRDGMVITAWYIWAVDLGICATMDGIGYE